MNTFRNILAVISAAFVLTSCNTNKEPTSECLETPHMRPDMDVFDIDWGTLNTDKFPNHRVSKQEQKRLLSNAYAIGGFADSDYSNGYASSFYFTKSKILSSKGVCHNILYGDMDDFAGIFLVLDNHQENIPALYLAGYNGSSGTADGMYEGAPVTKGRILNDTTIFTSTLYENYAFRDSGKRSFIDSVARLYRIDYKNYKFYLIKRDSTRRFIDDYFN